MPDPSVGSEPKPGAPSFFMFDGVALASIAPGAAPFFSLPLLDLPTFPQVTADFCSVGPPEDVASAADFALLATGVIGIATGAYRRVGNLVKANKWSELCQFKPAPVVLPRTGYCIPPGDGWYYFNIGTVPAHAQSVTVTIYSVTGRGGTPVGGPGLRITQTDASVPSQPWTRDLTIGANAFDVDVTEFPRVIEWEMDHGNWNFDQTFYLDGPFPIVPEQCADVELRYVPAGAAPTEFPPPDELVAPDDYPTVGPCDSPSLADLCRAIAALDTRVRWIADQLAPPEMTPDDVEETPEVDPDTGKLKPLEKPASAVGVILSASFIPSYIARYGTSPVFYPALGHVALTLLEGPLPSMLIKHSPMVVAPIPPQVKTVDLDVNEGVLLTARWLYPPKEGPGPKTVPPEE